MERIHVLSTCPWPSIVPLFEKPALSLPLPAASLHSETWVCSAIKGRGKQKNKRTKEPIMYEEDIYTIDEGWKANLKHADKVLNLSGYEVTTKFLKQLQEEKILSESAETNTIVSRSTHKVLQVISGKVGRKKLISPKGMDVRPMMEVVRGAIFDMLQARIAGYRSFTSCRWLDLYSGTGSVGIEALSRGCSEVVEYPSQSEVLETCGPLSKVHIRRYGRTHVAIYGPDGML